MHTRHGRIRLAENRAESVPFGLQFAEMPITHRVSLKGLKTKNREKSPRKRLSDHEKPGKKAMPRLPKEPFFVNDESTTFE